jgi:hypothetical protein
MGFFLMFFSCGFYIVKKLSMYNISLFEIFTINPHCTTNTPNKNFFLKSCAGRVAQDVKATVQQA